MNQSIIFETAIPVFVICFSMLALWYIISQSILFKVNKFRKKDDNEMNFKKFIYTGNYIKWVLGSILVYFLVTYINDTFKNREVDVEEMKQFQTYENKVLLSSYDDKIKYATYYSIITPNPDLRTRWQIYLDTLRIAPDSSRKYNLQVADSNLPLPIRIQSQIKANHYNSIIQPLQNSSPALQKNNGVFLSRIDVTFYDVKAFYWRAIDFEIYDPLTRKIIFNREIPQGTFLNVNYPQRYSIDNISISKQDVKNYQIHLNIPESVRNDSAVYILCSFFFYYTNGDVTQMKRVAVYTVPSAGVYGDSGLLDINDK